jgi:hypothetical protein
MTTVTTTTFSFMSTSHNLGRLAPTAWEFVAPLLAFTVVVTLMGIVAIRHRRS